MTDEAVMSAARQRLGRCRRLVVKIGSALITGDGAGVDRAAVADWAGQIAALRARGIQVVLVSSGAVAEGQLRLGWRARPVEVTALQAAAAVGQMGLIGAYDAAFARHDLQSALILLTHDDLSNRQRYLNARATLRELLALGVVPVINENDTVATDEIRFGDNDTLAALVTNLLEADGLVILTDQQGLHERDPRVDDSAPLVSEARANDAALDAMAGGAGIAGRGGMQTKLRAARVAARCGALTAIVHGRIPNVLEQLLAGTRLGTLLTPDERRMDARKRWLAGQLQMRGHLSLDAGAVRVITSQGRSLLPIGVRHCEGHFLRGDVVACLDPAGREVARGLVNYSADEARRILGKSSSQIAGSLGYAGEPELIHRDNLVVTAEQRG